LFFSLCKATVTTCPPCSVDTDTSGTYSFFAPRGGIDTYRFADIDRGRVEFRGVYANGTLGPLYETLLYKPWPAPIPTGQIDWSGWYTEGRGISVAADGRLSCPGNIMCGFYGQKSGNCVTFTANPVGGGVGIQHPLTYGGKVCLSGSDFTLTNIVNSQSMNPTQCCTQPQSTVVGSMLGDGKSIKTNTAVFPQSPDVFDAYGYRVVSSRSSGIILYMMMILGFNAKSLSTYTGTDMVAPWDSDIVCIVCGSWKGMGPEDSSSYTVTRTSTWTATGKKVGGPDFSCYTRTTTWYCAFPDFFGGSPIVAERGEARIGQSTLGNIKSNGQASPTLAQNKPFIDKGIVCFLGGNCWEPAS